MRKKQTKKLTVLLLIALSIGLAGGSGYTAFTDISCMNQEEAVESEPAETEIQPEESGEAEPSPEIPDESGEEPHPSGEELEIETEAETPETPFAAPAAYALKSNEAVVKNYSELKAALSNDNGITTVYFGDNITIGLTGVHIHSSKANVIIDGINPLDPGQTEPYTLTDHNSATFTDTIYIDSSGVKSVLVRDLNITGKNYFGPVSIADVANLGGIALTYERVDYNGPQLGFHRQGTIHLKDCSVRIHGANGLAANQEFSEAKHLQFYGNNSVTSETSAYSIFWHPFGGSFELSDNSSLTLISPDTSDTFGVFYAGGTAYKVDVTIGKRAVLNMRISGVVTKTANVTLSSLTVREGGEFNLNTTKASGAAVLRLGGTLKVEKEARFTMSLFGGNYPALRQETGDIEVEKDASFHIMADSPHSTLITLVGRSFICRDPLSVVLYNANRDISAATSAGQITLEAQQINYWNNPSPGGLDNPALYKWARADGTNFLIEGKFSIGTGGNFTQISSNYAGGNPPGTEPNASSFSMVNARVIALGRLELSIASADTKSKSICGVTAPGAIVRLTLSQGGVDYVFPDVMADTSGIFQIPIDLELTEDTLIKIKSSWQYLTSEAQATVKSEGLLEFFVPELMEFFSAEIALHTRFVKRLNEDWKIVISDNREAGGDWSIYARLNSELTPNNPEYSVLAGALIFVNAFGEEEVLSTDKSTLIYSHTPKGEKEVFPIIWSDDKGILLKIVPYAAFTGARYTASISWTLVNAP